MIPKDKLLHMIMGAITCATLYGLRFLPDSVSVLVGCALFGVFYELQQWYRGEGTPDVNDAVATAVPGIVFYFVLEFTNWIH